MIPATPFTEMLNVVSPVISDIAKISFNGSFADAPVATAGSDCRPRPAWKKIDFAAPTPIKSLLPTAKVREPESTDLSRISPFSALIEYRPT